MTEAAAQAKTVKELMLEKIAQKKQDSRTDLVFSTGFGLLGLGVAVTASVLFPPAGIVAAVGFVAAIGGAFDVIRDTARLNTLGKGEREVAGDVTDAARTRSNSLSSLNKLGKKLMLFVGGGLATVLGAAIFAPALLPATAALSLISAIAWPAVAVLTVAKVLDGAAKGAQDVVNAVDNPTPEIPAEPKVAPAAAERAPAKGLRSKLGALLGAFKKASPPVQATPAAPEAAAPEAKAPAPTAPK